MDGIIFFSNNFDRARTISLDGVVSNVKHWKISGIDELTVENIRKTDCIVIPWDSRNDAFKYLYNNIERKEVWLYNDEFLVDIEDHQLLVQIRDTSVLDKRWDICKGINEVIIYTNILHKKIITNCYPTKLQIETTDVCNAKCIMCSHAIHQGTGEDLVKKGILDKIRELLPYLREVVLHGNGEPFINANLIDLLNVFKQYNINFITNTNLSYINEVLLNLLNENFVELNVSCDGHTKEIYESIRCGLDFDSFVKNVELVRTHCPHLFMNMAVVVMRQNLQYLPDLVSFAAKLGFDKITFNQLCVSEKNNNACDAPYLYLDTYRRAIEKAVDVATESNIQICCPEIKSDNMACETEHSNDSCIGICDWLVEMPYINLQGDVGVCCINQNKRMGNIFESDLDDIWNGDAYQYVRSSFYSGRLPKECQGCDFILQNRLKYVVDSNVSLLKK